MKVILTGATGMVGEGVLHECLLSSDVEQVLVLGRNPCGTAHPKLREIVHENFFNLMPIAGQLAGYDACFFCLGVSAIGKSEAQYFRLTHTLTLHAAEIMVRRNPGMTFCYISGAGTDSSEGGRAMWARVKGKTENDLMKLPFKRLYAVRPGFLLPTPGLKNTLGYYKVPGMGLLYSVGRALAPNWFSTLRELGLGMIRAVTHPPEKRVLEIKDILALVRIP